MNAVRESRGLVLLCEPTGSIAEVLYDGLGVNAAAVRGRSWQCFLDPGSLKKADLLLERIERDGAVFNWELVIELAGGPAPAHFAGIDLDGRHLIVAAETDHALTTLVREFHEIGNEQANQLRRAVEEAARRTADSEPVTLSAYDEISRLNNELVNLQRQLAKQNHELARLNDEKNRFLGIAAHDLRNPLGNAMALTEFVQGEPERLSEEQREFLAHLQKLIMFMLTMVEDLLDVANIEAGKIALHRERADLAEVVRHAVRMNLPLAERKAIAVTVSADEGVPHAWFDAAKVEQVVNNLLTNAIKYSPAESRVAVTVSRQQEAVQVAVADQGVGIPQAEQERLFLPFQRGSGSTTAGEKSTGLGLFIARRIIEAHGGVIELVSAPGEGSRFSFTIPIEP